MLTSPPAVPTRHIVGLQALKSALAQAAELTETLPEAALHWRPTPDEWTMHNLLAHLSAAEAPFLKRLRRIVDEDSPWLPYFGPEVAKPEATATRPELLAEWQATREQLLQFLSALPPEAWDRPATHETMGATTLALQVQNLISHDATHLEQLRAVRHAWETHHV